MSCHRCCFSPVYMQISVEPDFSSNLDEQLQHLLNIDCALALSVCKYVQ